MLRSLTLSLVALFALAACDSPSNGAISGDALRELYVGNSFSFVRADGSAFEYHAPDGKATYVHVTRGRNFSGNYAINGDEICYTYKTSVGPHCWHTFTTDVAGTYTIKMVDSDFTASMTYLGKGKRF